MKKILITAILSIASLGAYASDISQYSGPYVGLHIGYAQGDFKGDDTFSGINISSYSYNLSKYLWGGLVGYNKVFDNHVLVGIEADYEQRNADSTGPMTDVSLSNIGTVQTKIQNAYSLRVRFGKIFNDDKTLAYLTAGYGAVDINSNFAITGLAAFSKSEWKDGYTAGFGFEHFVSEAISIKTDYRYSQYGKMEASAMDPSSLVVSSELTKYENENSLRVGLMYHF